MGCGQSKKIHLYPKKNKNKSNGKKGHGEFVFNFLFNLSFINSQNTKTISRARILATLEIVKESRVENFAIKVKGLSSDNSFPLLKYSSHVSSVKTLTTFPFRF